MRRLLGDYLRLDNTLMAAWAEGAVYASEAAATMSALERQAAATYSTSTPQHFSFGPETVFDGPDDSWYYNPRYAILDVLHSVGPHAWGGDGIGYADVRDQLVEIIDEAAAVERWPGEDCEQS